MRAHVFLRRLEPRPVERVGFRELSRKAGGGAIRSAAWRSPRQSSRWAKSSCPNGLRNCPISKPNCSPSLAAGTTTGAIRSAKRSSTGRAFVQAQKFGAEIIIPAEAENLDCRRADGVFGLALKRRMLPRMLDCYRDRSALSASRRFRPSTLRRKGSLVLGFTDRSQALREPGCNRCRRRQFRRAGGGVPLHHVGQGPDDGAWRRAGRNHLAVPH